MVLPDFGVLGFVVLLCLVAVVAAFAAAPSATTASGTAHSGCPAYHETAMTLYLPAGYWQALGRHSYYMRLVRSSDPAQDDFFGPYEFTVSDLVPVYPDEVRMSLFGARYPGMGRIDAINPAQNTSFLAMFVWAWGASAQEVRAEVADAAVYVAWDGGPEVRARQRPVVGACFHSALAARIRPLVPPDLPA